MSAALQNANDLDSVAPFIRAAVPASVSIARIEDRMVAYRAAEARDPNHHQSNERARFAIEGGPIQPADVPGAPFSPSTTTGN